MSIREFTEFAKDLFSDLVTKPTATVSRSKWIPWYETAKKYMGLKEIRGRKSNSTIINWAKALGRSVSSIYNNDDIPWCGLFVAACLNENGIKHGLDNPLGAQQWKKFGVEVEPCPGAIMVFWRGSPRSWKGHVGFYVSEDKYNYHILGGNQSNSVNVTKISKKRLISARWPSNYPTLHNRVKGRVYKTFDGKVSTNEE
jgi:uncharacterized protein (TIGR02594 family)